MTGIVSGAAFGGGGGCHVAMEAAALALVCGGVLNGTVSGTASSDIYSSRLRPILTAYR